MVPKEPLVLKETLQGEVECLQVMKVMLQLYVVCLLAYCGYCIGKNNGFQAGIQACLVYMGDIGAIKIKQLMVKNKSHFQIM